MSAKMLRRIEELEAELERRRAFRKGWKMFWFDPTTGVRTDENGDVVSS